MQLKMPNLWQASAINYSSANMPILLVAFVGVGYALYRWMLPKPFPGIPHTEKATRRLLGDVPDMISFIRKTDTLFPWFAEQAIKLHSPIIQLFARPFSRPWVIIYDARESRDILTRRFKEFDRSDAFIELFLSVLPDNQVAMHSSDERFKYNRAIMRDLMTPPFLQNIAAPQIYAAVETLLELWSVRSDIAKGHPFSVLDDLFDGALDAIFATAFGLKPEDSNVRAQQKLLLKSSVHVPANVDEPISFPQATRPPIFEALLALVESLETAVKSPFPRQHSWLLFKMPKMRRMVAIKEKFISAEIQKGVHRLETEAGQRCALDDVLRRERAIAEKENRQPAYHNRSIYDDASVMLMGFLGAGHETTSTTMCWGLKYLADNQPVQARLRVELRKAYPAAVTEQRALTAKEIATAQIPYLDAVIEEIVRTGMTFAGVSRTAMVDATVLGYHIPKGTNVFLMQNGPGFLSEPFPIDESKRSEPIQTTDKSRVVGSWNPNDRRAFKPERWLVRDADTGQGTFDANAEPHLTFGLGPRMCYGKRLGMLNLKFILSMLIWRFELQHCPPKLSGYEAVDSATRRPKQCYVRLATVPY